MLERMGSSTKPPPGGRLDQSRAHGGAAVIGRVMLFVARVVVTALALTFWVAVAPIWMVMVARAMIVYALLSVLAAFAGRGPPDPRNVEAILVLWPRGALALLGILSGTYDTEPAMSIQDDAMRLLRQTGLVVLLVIGVMVGQIAVAFGTAYATGRSIELPWFVSQAGGPARVVPGAFVPMRR